MRRWRWMAATVVAFLALTPLAQGQWLPDRRKDQFPKEFSYLVFPLPYSLPGIGSGIYLPLYAANLFGTYTDAYALFVTGDATGSIYAVEDVHLVEKRLIASVFYQDITKATYKNYTLRGMDTKQDDFQIVELNSVKSLWGELRLTFADRRFELAAGRSSDSHAAKAVRDHDGNLIARFAEPVEQKFESTEYSMTLDLTDDRQDPRRGLRTGVSAQDAPRNSADDPAYSRMNVGLTGYVPIGRISTLALHAFRSDAYVRGNGDTDPATVRRRVFLACPPGDAACQAAEDSQVNNAILRNRHGNSAPLGGESLLRGYSDSRYQGAHTLYYGAEFRWNVTEEFSPFDYLFWKDVRTGIQIAFFYEQGTVSETLGTLGQTWRSDSGVGLRVVTASGAVFRADYAVGQEGAQTVIIVNYPF